MASCHGTVADAKTKCGLAEHSETERTPARGAPSSERASFQRIRPPTIAEGPVRPSSRGAMTSSVASSGVRVTTARNRSAESPATPLAERTITRYRALETSTSKTVQRSAPTSIDSAVHARAPSASPSASPSAPTAAAPQSTPALAFAPVARRRCRLCCVERCSVEPCGRGASRCAGKLSTTGAEAALIASLSSSKV